MTPMSAATPNDDDDDNNDDDPREKNDDAELLVRQRHDIGPVECVIIRCQIMWFDNAKMCDNIA